MLCKYKLLTSRVTVCFLSHRAFNLAVVLHLSSTRGEIIRPEDITPALQSVVKRHSILRTTIHEVVNSGIVSLVQKVHPPSAFRDCNIRTIPEDSECDVQSLIREDVFTPFNLTEQQYHFTLFVLSPQKLVLCMTFHHIVMDGASLHIVVREVQRLIAGQQLSASVLPQFVDLVKKDGKRDAEKDVLLQRWINLLGLVERCTSFGNPHPTHFDHSPQSYLNTQQYLQVPQTTLDAMKAARGSNVSSVILLATAFAFALCRYTGATDIVFGMLTMNRSRESENVLGCLANALPLHVDFRKSKTLDDLLKQVRMNYGLILDGGIDLAELVPHIPCLQRGFTTPVRTSPLQVFFSFYNVGQERLAQVLKLERGVEVKCDIQVPKPEHTHADLFFEASKNQEDVFYWESRKSVLGVSKVHHLHSLMCQAIEDLAAQKYTGSLPATQVVRPSIAEHSEDVNQVTSVPYSHLFYIERFEIKASDIPDRPAFKHNGVTFTYCEAVLIMRKIAAWLWEKGLRPCDRVAVYLTRTPRLYLSILAVLKFAAAYVPIALQNSPRRIAKILKRANAKILITEESLRKAVPSDWTGKTLCLDPGSNLLVADSFVTLPKITYHAKHLFYIIFTSGTTGEPKGVAITNGNMRATLNNFKRLLTPEDTQVTLASLNVAFDAHVQDSLAPLLNGACVVVAEDITEISHGVTYAAAAVSAASVVKFPSSMQVLGVGGEPFTQQCYENTKTIPKVINFYGPTECTVFATTNRVTGSEHDISNIGKPLPGVKVMVLDESKQLVPISCPGILHIGGPIVSSVGYYYSDAQQTKKAFIPNPLDPSETIYCTGDCVCMVPDGSLQFLGRIDDQVKLRGMRFQLLEVEQTLLSCPHVSAAVATVRNQSMPSAQLVAYVTPKHISTMAVLQYVSCHLPSYMVPSVIVALDKMPLTREGKVDKKALSRLPLEAHVDSVSEPSDQQSSELAMKLATIFGQVLGIKEFPPTADFFSSGGHSLLIFTLVTLINQQMHCDINISHVIQNTTPVSLAAVVEETLQEDRKAGPYIPPEKLIHYQSDEVLQSHLKLKAQLEFQHSSKEQTEILQPPNSPEELPIFFIHAGVIGWSLPYTKLAQSLGRYSVAIQRTSDTPTSSLQEMAASLIQAVRSVQPHGPYKVAGLCFGAYLVYEMSKQLSDAGEQVELVVLLDNSPVSASHPKAFNEAGQPLPSTPAHPVHFFQRVLDLQFPPQILQFSKEDVNIDDITAIILTTYHWLPFSATDLKDAYVWFISYLRCCLFNYCPQPCSTIENSLLIRNKEHKLFASHDYGLLQLVRPETLSVVIAPRDINVGELSEKRTVNFITSAIELYLNK